MTFTPPSLQAQVQAAFSADGWLAKAEPHFRPRAGQTAMAEAVAQAIEQHAVLVAEAGTGVGKTYSYLVPALLSGQRVLVSTATKALQDQLFLRDLPRLVQTLGLPLRTARLKGRSSYLCLHRLGDIHQSPTPLEPQVLRAITRIEQWSHATVTGDLAELPGLAENSHIAAMVTSTKDNCLGSRCAHWERCHVNTARAQAMEADVCVVNHHLFFADMELRDSGAARLLPQAGVVVIDEAHQLNETGIQFAGWVLGSQQLLGYLRDVLAGVLMHARGLRPWMDLIAHVEQGVNGLRALAGGMDSGTRLRWWGLQPEGLSPHDWQWHLHQLGRALRQLLTVLAQVADAAVEIVHLYERGSRLLGQLAAFARPVPEDAVRWLDVARQHIKLCESPLNIARLMREEMGALGEPAGEQGAPPRSKPQQAWIFTSATLGDDPDLRWFTESTGLRQARVLRVDSPFDYARQAVLYVPDDVPEPQQQAAHSAAVAQLAAQGANALGGRTLVLTTTLKALEHIGHHLQQHFGLLEPMDVLVQGQGPKHVLMERFRQGTVNGRGCVLVASSTFWEGVDIRGDALQLVVIDKLPFPPPDDPLVEARSRQLEAVGRSPFGDYMLPAAAMDLKQGAGRLIRSETDVGILVIADTRLRSKGYGRRLVEALPPMHRVGSRAQWQAALQALAKGQALVPEEEAQLLPEAAGMDEVLDAPDVPDVPKAPSVEACGAPQGRGDAPVITLPLDKDAARQPLVVTPPRQADDS